METETPHIVDRLLIGASASIGVVNLSAYITSFQMHRFAKEVQVILTEQATNFINPATLRLFCQGVHTKMMDETSGSVKHIELAEWAQIFAILPASADMIGKAANGLATDLLSSTILASCCPVVFFPNMNQMMYAKPVVQRNLQQLKDDGHYVIPPIKSMGYQVSKQKVVESLSIPQPANVIKILAKVFQENH